MKTSHHKYTWTARHGTVTHQWELLTATGGIVFHVAINESFGSPACGIEKHSNTGKGAPDHSNCWLTHRWCWHDGSSLYASERLWPMIEPLLLKGDHARIFQILELDQEKEIGYNFYS